MARYIDADRLVKDLKSCGCVTAYAKEFIEAVIHRINLQPAVDVAEVTKYNEMISSFAADFYLAQQGDHKLQELQSMINNKTPHLTKDIELLEELDFNLRHGKLKIFEGV